MSAVVLTGLALLSGFAVTALIAGGASAAAALLAVGPSASHRLDRCLRVPARADLRLGGLPSVRERPGEGWLGVLRSPPIPAVVALPVPVAIDLVASVVEAGAAPEAALRLVSGALRNAGDPAAAGLTDHGTAAPQWRPLFAALHLARSVGLGPVGLLRSAAAEQRRRRAESLAVAARRLAVLALLPTSLCLLPAFLLLAVVPLVLGLLTS